MIAHEIQRMSAWSAVAIVGRPTTKLRPAKPLMNWPSMALTRRRRSVRVVIDGASSATIPCAHAGNDMTLADALGVTARDTVALVGGGGKTSAMFRLAKDVVDKGGHVITTTTTKIFAAQIALAPAHVPARDATRARVADALARHAHVLVIGEKEPDTGKAEGISSKLFADLRAWFPDA